MAEKAVLVIDDDQEIRDSLALLFEGEGYDVLLAPDGLEGLRLLSQAKRPLIVLLDLMMPRMSGYELLRWLVDHPAMRDGHVLVIFSARTAALPPGYRQVLEQLNIQTVAKPTDIDHLIATIHVAEAQLPAP
jgi:CheY-like chemotaxis protein